MSDFTKDTNVFINDYISRQMAIRWVKTECNPYGKPTLDFESGKKVIEHLEQMPSAQPEVSRIEDALHGKSAEEQYDFLWWLMQYYGMQFTDTRVAVIAWLKGEENEQIH